MDARIEHHRYVTHQRLRHYLGEKNSAAAMRAMERLRAQLARTASPREHARVLLAYGGGKDSSYMVAFARLVQLLMAETHGQTIQLRVITNRHAGMPRAVLDNIARTYDALAFQGDPDVEMLLLDGERVSEFSADLPMPAELIERNRIDILMAGHRCYGDGRPTFCNACNLSMVSAFAIGAAHGDGVDVVITGDSLREQAAYLAWVRRLARQLHLPVRQLRDFKSFVEAVDGISSEYFADIRRDGPPRRDLGPAQPVFFSIYQDTAYEVADHWDLLTEFLGFVFDDLAFSFTESDCANPALMAHLRGLRSEHVIGTGYDTGVDEYVTFATNLMRVKKFPETLIETMHRRYATPGGKRLMHRRITDYAAEAFGLTAEQLVCLVYSPFAQGGRHLRRYLSAECPALSPMIDEIRGLLASDRPVSDEFAGLARDLERQSGLSLRHLRILYRSALAAATPGEAAGPTTPIGLILADDPHKGLVLTRNSPVAPYMLGPISGR